MADLEAVLADVSYLMAMEKSKCTPAARASKKIILPDPRYTSSPYSAISGGGACGSIRRGGGGRRRQRPTVRRRTSPHFLPLPSLSFPLLFSLFSSSFTVSRVLRSKSKLPMHLLSDDALDRPPPSRYRPVSRVCQGIKKMFTNSRDIESRRANI